MFDPTITTPQKIRILLADDHPLLCSALRELFSKQDNFEIIGEANDGLEAVKLAAELLPDIVIMDINMPRLDGFKATEQIKKEHPDVLVLVLTVYNDNEHIFKILQAGADSYITKNAKKEQIVHAINALFSGETVFSPEVSRQLLKYAFQNIPRNIKLETGDKISTRELKVLRLLARGLSNKDIANTLGLTTRTVKAYLAEIFLKLEVGSRTEAVIACIKKGIIDLEDLE